MVGLTLGMALGIGLPLLALHMMSVALAKALRTYSRSRLEELCARKGRPERADAVAHYDERTERGAEALAVITGLGLAALLGASAAALAPLLTAEAIVGISLALGAIGYMAAGVVGRVYAEPLLDFLWPLASPLRKLMYPLTTVSRLAEALAVRLVRRSAAGPRPASVEVEIHSVSLEHPSQDLEAELPESAREVLERVVELTRRDIAAMMTPWSAVVALPEGASLEEAAHTFRESGRSRIPLYGVNRDDIVGVLHIKDVFAALVDADSRAQTTPRKLARPAFCVPESKNAYELLDELRTRKTHLAIVLDEYGGVAGMVTFEDLLEELLGPIEDEHDAPAPADPIRALGDAQFEIDAALPLDELNERLGLHLPTNGDIQTVGGFAFNTLGYLPEPGASFRYEGMEFTVLDVGEHAIRRLRLDLQPAEAPSSTSPQ